MKTSYWLGLAFVIGLAACGGEQTDEPQVDGGAPEAAVAPETETPSEPEVNAEAEPEPVEPPQASAGGGAPPTLTLENVFDITADQAQKLLAYDQNVQVLDIRTPGEFEQGAIPGALNIDFRGSDFKAQIAQLDRATPYVVHCASGGRSGNSMDLFKELGFQKIYHMTDGFNGWSSLESAPE